MRIVFQIILFLLPVLETIAQPFNIRSYSFPQGLTTYNIKKTLQDKYGFLWIATKDGLYRFGGKTFEPFRKVEGDTSSIRENHITDICFGAGDDLYVSSVNGGIDLINIRSLKITHLLSEKTTNRDGLPDLRVNSLYYTGRDQLWIGGKDYLFVYQVKEKKLIEVSKMQLSVRTLNISFIKAIDSNTIAASLVNQGVLIFDSKSLKLIGHIRSPDTSGTTHRVSFTVNDMIVYGIDCFFVSGDIIYQGKWSNRSWTPVKKTELNEIGESSVTCIHKNKENEFWLGTNTGLGLLDLSTGKFSYIPESPKGPDMDFISHLFIDRENNLWVSTSRNLRMISLDKNPFRSYTGGKEGDPYLNHLFSMASLNDREIYATGIDGFYKCDLVSGRTFKIPGSGKLGVVHYLLNLKPGIWLVSTDRGMYVYEPATGRLSRERLLELYPEWSQFSDHYFNNAVSTGNKIYWASEEEEGLVIWDTVQKKIYQIKVHTDTSVGLPENHILNIKTDRKGMIWLLFERSVAQFDPVKEKITLVFINEGINAGLNASLFYDMYDDEETYWFASYGGGLSGYHKKSGTWSYITEREGLSNNSVYSIVPENDSIFWVSTNNGLSRVNHRAIKCQNYFTEDGIHENSFDERGALQIGDKILFAGINGFTVIDISLFNMPYREYPVYVRKMEYMARGIRYKLNDLGPGYTVFPAGTSFINISLSAVTFSHNSKIRFSYKIIGKQRAFIEVDKDNNIQLNAPKYGDYLIEFRYLDERGDIISDKLNLAFFIKPFWYQSMIFKVVVILLSLLLVGYILRLVYLYRIRKHRNEMEKQMAVQYERNRISSEMHDDIGAGLSGIRLMTEMAKSRSMDRDHADDIDRIYYSVGEISAKMKEVIWSLNTDNDNLVSLFSFIQKQVKVMLENYPCQLYFEIPEQVPDINIPGPKRRHILLAVKEGVHNIIKHSGADEVRIMIQCDSLISISINDNGKGTDPGSRYSGEGLKNMKRRMEEIGGIFTINNSQGTTLHFSIPVKQIT